MAKHLVLLGDSIFDNSLYVSPGEADVTKHLEHKLHSMGWTLEMRAVDGAFAADIQFQINLAPLSLPCEFVLSVGGNMRSGKGWMRQIRSGDQRKIGWES